MVKKKAGFHNLAYIDTITKEFHMWVLWENLEYKQCLRRMDETKGRVITAQEKE